MACLTKAIRVPVSCFGFLAAALPASTPPNIVIFVADDLGWADVGFQAEDDIRTPHIDALSRQSLILDRFYVSSVCSPTRAALLTGRYPHRFGLERISPDETSQVIPPWRDHGMPADEQMLPAILGEIGYKNRALIGKWHLGHARQRYHPLKHGFTHFYGHYNGAIDYFEQTREGQRDWHDGWLPSADSGYVTEMAGDRAVQWVDEFAADGPFYLQVAFLAPHTPLQALPEDLRSYGFSGNSGRLGYGDNDRQTFKAMVTAMDRQIGRVLDRLEANGVAENTIVIFFSDNGGATLNGANNGPLRGRKHQVWEGGIRSPFTMRWLGKLPEGERISQVTAHVDLLPTLISAAGAPDFPYNNPLDGKDLWQVLSGQAEPVERMIYLGQKALMTQEWKLVGEALFRIDKDPYETTNLASRFPEKWQELNAEMLRLEALQGPRLPPFKQGSRGFTARPNWDIRLTPEK